jgi:ubiquinone biosynthesis protein UbiJ
MNQTKLTVEDVMLRIKETMKAEKLNQKGIESTDENTSEDNGYNVIENQLQKLDFEVQQNNLKWNIITEWLITSHRKTIGRFIVFGKRALRKVLRWYINPLFDQQREFNGSVTRSLNVISELLHNYAGEIEKNRISIENLNERLDALQRENNELLHNYNGEIEKTRISIENLNERLDTLQRENNELLHNYNGEIEKTRISIENLNERLDTLQRENNELLHNHAGEIENTIITIENLSKALNVLQKENADLKAFISKFDKQTEAELTLANDRLRRLERKINEGLNLNPNIPTIDQLVEEDKANHYDFDYFLF